MLQPKAIFGCICDREIKDSFMNDQKESKNIIRYHWDSGTKSFAYRFSELNNSYTSTPYYHDQYVVMLEGRIDEIKGEQIYSDQQNVSEKELLSCYLKYGKDLPNRVYGDWSFAIYDGKIDELFISRDHNGNSVMHYAMYENSFYFATLLGDLLENTSIHPVLDERSLLDIQYHIYWKSERTSYKDIFRIPPGTSLIYNKGQVKLTPYWFPEELPGIIYRNDADYYEHFRELFFKAVENRLRFSLKPAVALSGGLDSGAVASVAATILDGTNRKLQAYTAVPAFDVQKRYKKRMTNEWPIVLSLINRYKNIDAVKFDSLNYSPIDTVERAIAIFREPVWAVANYVWLFDLFERTTNNNDTLLTGQMGNKTISWPFPGWKYGWNNLLIKDLKKIYSLVFRRKVHLERFKSGSLLRTSFISDHLSINSYIRNQYPVGILNLNNILSYTLRLRNNYSGAEWKACSIKFGTNMFDPTNDRHLMEFVLNIPSRIFSNGNGSRLLVRQGLKEYLPQEYLLNSIRGVQASDTNQRLEFHKDELLEELNRIKRKPVFSKYYDIDKVDQLISDVLSKNTDKNPTLNLLMQIAMLGFIELFEENE